MGYLPPVRGFRKPFFPPRQMERGLGGEVELPDLIVKERQLRVLKGSTCLEIAIIKHLRVRHNHHH